jgi:hypothetical protein
MHASAIDLNILVLLLLLLQLLLLRWRLFCRVVCTAQRPSTADMFRQQPNRQCLRM